MRLAADDRPELLEKGSDTMLAKCADMVSKALCSVRKGRRVRPPSGLVKVNIGCGLSVAPGWINVDMSPIALGSKWPAFLKRRMYRAIGGEGRMSFEQYSRLLSENVFVHHNFVYGLPFEDSSVDFIYSSHVLEHLYRNEALRLMHEARRVLKPGGVVRTCVPDLERTVRLYLHGRKEEAMRHLFPADAPVFSQHRHKYMYDFELLSKLLGEAGFEDVRLCQFGQGIVPDIDRLDNRPEVTLFTEAVKGGAGAP
jgi:predicted SAM-dependent methyltransferase